MLTLPIRVALTGDIDDGLEDLESCLRPLVEMLKSSSVRMTLPVTAAALKNHARKFVYLADEGHEVAGHGDVHEPFVGPMQLQVRRLRAMNDQFVSSLGFRPIGFRAPYLAHDESLYEALSQTGFQYDSSKVSKDPLLYLRYGLSRHPPIYRGSIANIVRVFKMYAAGESTAKPFRIAEGLLELPVFELDDWFFFESPRGPRLEAHREELVTRLWGKVLRHFSFGENLLVIQAHPKRMSPGRLKILEAFIAAAKLSGHRFVTLQEFVQQGFRP